MSNSQIHPTAIIADTAKLGNNVSIGPFAIIGEHTCIGDNCIIDAHAVIQNYTKMGAHNRVHPHAVIGGDPQDLSFNPATVTWTEIGDHNTFRENVTISRASFEDKATQIGSHCFFMNNTHVAHDCIVGDNNIFATGSALGGHVHVGNRVFFGGGAMVHQFCRVGSFVMVAAVLVLRKDVLPYTLVGGQPVRHYRLNTIGLRRAGITGERYNALSKAFRCLKSNRPIDDSIDNTEEVQHLSHWLAGESKRGIYGFAAPKSND